MDTKQRVTFILLILMIVMFLGLLINLTKNSRDYALSFIEDKAEVVSESVKHGLTAHMRNGFMDNRDFFLNEIKNLSNVEKIWIVRSPLITKQYGEGREDEKPKDKIDQQVINTGVKIKHIDENLFSQSKFRITIPYIAEKTPTIDCTKCHNVREGQTLGAISMVIDIDDAKIEGISITIMNATVSLILIITVLFFFNYVISPYIHIFQNIKKVMKAAEQGDYSNKVDINSKSKEAKEVAEWINSLLFKINNALNDINSNLETFLNKDINKINEDPLVSVKNNVKRLADIYKFKKTIEIDNDITDIYKRIEFILSNKLNIKHFNIIEIDTNTKLMNNINNQNTSICNIDEIGCKASVKHTTIDSCQFENICNKKEKTKPFNLCFPYPISNGIDIVINIESHSEKEHLRVKNLKPYIDDYINTAKPEIVSKKLMKILEESALTDSLTGLYNRKFLDQNIVHMINQSKRSNSSFGILMCDIDYFKMINDNYGHDIGDEALRVIANTLTETVRNSDYVIRYGGEEFIVFLYNCDKDYLHLIAEKIRENFSHKKIHTPNESFSKTLSIGASMYPNDDDSLWKCIKYADLALYKAKNSGRNKVIVYSPETIKSIDDKF